VAETVKAIDKLKASIKAKKLSVVCKSDVRDEDVTKFSRECEFVSKNEEKRLVYGVVYAPDEYDTDGEWALGTTIEAAAHQFMLEHQTMKVQHLVTNESIAIVESYIAPADFILDGERIVKGTWMLVSKVFDDEVWELVKTGDLTGYSMGGYSRRIAEELPGR